MTMQVAVTTGLSQRSATKTLTVSIRRTGPNVRPRDLQMHQPRHCRGWCLRSGRHRHHPTLSGWRRPCRRRQYGSGGRCWISRLPAVGCGWSRWRPRWWPCRGGGHGPSIFPLPAGNRRFAVGITPSDACGLDRALVAASPASHRVKRLRFSRHRVAALPHHCRLQGPPLPPMPGPKEPHPRGRTPAQRQRRRPGRGKGSRS